MNWLTKLIEEIISQKTIESYLSIISILVGMLIISYKTIMSLYYTIGKKKHEGHNLASLLKAFYKEIATFGVFLSLLAIIAGFFLLYLSDFKFSYNIYLFFLSIFIFGLFISIYVIINIPFIPYDSKVNKNFNDILSSNHRQKVRNSFIKIIFSFLMPFSMIGIGIAILGIIFELSGIKDEIGKHLIIYSMKEYLPYVILLLADMPETPGLLSPGMNGINSVAKRRGFLA